MQTHDDNEAKLTFLGVTISITTSRGKDRAPVIFVDTDDTIPDGERGPLCRIRLNDVPIYLGVKYDEDATA